MDVYVGGRKGARYIKSQQCNGSDKSFPDSSPGSSKVRPRIVRPLPYNTSE